MHSPYKPYQLQIENQEIKHPPNPPAEAGQALQRGNKIGNLKNYYL